MDYIMREYLVCTLAALGFTTVLFFLSAVLVLAQEGLRYLSQDIRKAGSRIPQLVLRLGGHAPEGGPSVSSGYAERAGHHSRFDEKLLACGSIR